MVYTQAVKLRDASFTFLAGWAQIAVLFVGADTQIKSGDLHVVDGQVGYTSLGYLLKMWPRIEKPL
jgi:hypothetical protein